MRVKRLLGLENAIDDPDQLVHDSAHDLHLVFPSLKQALSESLNRRTMANQDQSREIESLPQARITELTETSFAPNRGAGLKLARCQSGKGSELTSRVKPVEVADFSQEEHRGMFADARNGDQECLGLGKRFMGLNMLAQACFDSLHLRFEKLEMLLDIRRELLTRRVQEETVLLLSHHPL